jgi:hypothetical protein
VGPDEEDDVAPEELMTTSCHERWPPRDCVVRLLERGAHPFGWSLIWSLMDPVSCVSCVSWMCWLYAAETHETFHWESGMRYHSNRVSRCSIRQALAAGALGA